MEVKQETPTAEMERCEFNCNKISLNWIYISVSDASKGLKNLTLSVYPEVIRRGQSAQLHCNYEVYDIPLYSVKWYRGIFEFYRYTPFEHPAGKTFFFNTGIKVDVSAAKTFIWCTACDAKCEIYYDEEPICKAKKISDDNWMRREC